MIVLFEGLDRCFKSSAIEQLRTEIKTPFIFYTHCGKPPADVKPKEWSKEFYDFYLENLSEIVTYYQDGTVLSDRSHIGETVYGPMFRKYNADYIWDLEDSYINEDWYLILFTDSTENLISRSDGKSLEKNGQQIDEVRTRFLESFQKSSIPNKLHIDFTKMNTVEAMDKIRKFLNV